MKILTAFQSMCWLACVVLASCATATPYELPLDPPRLEGSWSGDFVTEKGQEALMNGNALLAAQLFSAGIAQHSHEGSLFNNLAVSLATLGMEAGTYLLCEAHAAAQLALVLGYSDAKGLGEQIGSMLEGESCFRERLHEHRAFEHVVAGPVSIDEHMQMVNQLCSTPEKLMLRPSQRELQLGAWIPSNMARIWLLMRVCGVFAVEEVVPSQVVLKVLQAQSNRTESLILPKDRAFANSAAASRGSLRREVRLPLEPPFTDTEFVAQPLLRSLVKLILGERVEIDTFSCIDSAPGSRDQDWHNDVPTPRAMGCHQSPVGIVAALPLVDMNASNGATELLAGSHVDVGNDRFWMADGDGSSGGASTATPRLQFAVPAGSMVVFDLRLRHRGRANRATKSRSLVYMSYVQEWFRDGINFKSKQTRDWDALPAATRKLFARLDTERYIRLLETMLESSGVKVQELTSVSEHSQAKLEL